MWIFELWDVCKEKVFIFFNSALFFSLSECIVAGILVLHINWIFFNNIIQCFLPVSKSIIILGCVFAKWGIANDKTINLPGNRYVQITYNAAHILSSAWVRGSVTCQVDFSQVKIESYAESESCDTYKEEYI